MRLVTPKVRLICRPCIDRTETDNYLKEDGAADRDVGVVDLAARYEGGALVEFARQLCYRP
jgi:hypothetical protein